VAQKALNAGAQVVIASRTPEKLDAVAKRFGACVQTEMVDAADDQSVTDFYHRVGQFDHFAITIKPQLIASATAVALCVVGARRFATIALLLCVTSFLLAVGAFVLGRKAAVR